MSSERPACEIEPVLPTASRSLILPGPKARSEPKSTRTVNRMSPIGHPAPENGRKITTYACRLAWRSRLDRSGWRRLQDREQASKACGAQRQIALADQPA